MYLLNSMEDYKSKTYLNRELLLLCIEQLKQRSTSFELEIKERNK